MPMIIRQIKYLPLLLIIAALLLSACSTKAQTTTPPPVTNPPSQIVNRVEVVYFHLPARCVTCLCFEEQLKYIIQAYFKGEINTGKLIFKVLEIGKKENAPIFNKYNAYGSQLFINIITNDKDNFKEIQEIWSWKCPTDKNGFNAKIENLIEQSLSKLSNT